MGPWNRERSFANGNGPPPAPGRPGSLGWEWEMARETTIWDVGG